MQCFISQLSLNNKGLSSLPMYLKVKSAAFSFAVNTVTLYRDLPSWFDMFGGHFVVMLTVQESTVNKGNEFLNELCTLV